MQFKDHLIELFEFNDATNKKLFMKIGSLGDQDECIRLASHLINCQYKWMARLVDGERANTMSCGNRFILYINLNTNGIRALAMDRVYQYPKHRTSQPILFMALTRRLDGHTSRHRVAAKFSFHPSPRRDRRSYARRFEPDFVDFIGTKARKIN